MPKTRSILSVLLAVVVLGCSSSDSSSGGALAKLDDFCGKCGSCYATPNFSEGFCTPWINGTSFDRLGCSSKGDTTQLDNQDVTAAQVAGWSCQQFDDNE